MYWLNVTLFTFVQVLEESETAARTRKLGRETQSNPRVGLV